MTSRRKSFDNMLGAYPEGMSHVVYRLYDEGRRLLYVGMTKAFGSRMTAHATKHWWPQVDDVFVTFHESSEEAARVEEQEIREDAPPYNTRHHPDEELRRIVGPCDIAHKYVAPGPDVPDPRAVRRRSR